MNKKLYQYTLSKRTLDIKRKEYFIVSVGRSVVRYKTSLDTLSALLSINVAHLDKLIETEAYNIIYSLNDNLNYKAVFGMKNFDNILSSYVNNAFTPVREEKKQKSGNTSINITINANAIVEDEIRKFTREQLKRDLFLQSLDDCYN